MSVYFSHCSARFTYGNLWEFKQMLLNYYDEAASLTSFGIEQYPIYPLLIATDYDGKYEIACDDMVEMLPDLKKNN